MSGSPSKFVPRAELASTFDAWRRLQVLIDVVFRGWKRVFRGIAKLNRINADMREAWLSIYVARGDHIPHRGRGCSKASQRARGAGPKKGLPPLTERGGASLLQRVENRSDLPAN
jgi:hypothetical protein